MTNRRIRHFADISSFLRRPVFSTGVAGWRVLVDVNRSLVVVPTVLVNNAPDPATPPSCHYSLVERGAYAMLAGDELS